MYFSQFIIYFYIKQMENVEQEDTMFNMFSNIKKDQKPFIQSSNSQLNTLFQGGLHYGMITQIYGEAGSGKTQLAMLFSIGAIGRNQRVNWLSIEKQLHLGRFLQLAYSSMNQSEYEQKQNLFNYSRTEDHNLALQFLEELTTRNKKTSNGALLVIDTVHALIQAQSVGVDNIVKSRLQAQFVNRLRCLAKTSNTAVLLINNAADIIDRKSLQPRKFYSALGPAWQLNLDENIEISRKGQLREITILNSPKARCLIKNKFRIQKNGFTWVTQEGIQYQ